jgi:hypothetical protein
VKKLLALALFTLSLPALAAPDSGVKEEDELTFTSVITLTDTYPIPMPSSPEICVITSTTGAKKITSSKKETFCKEWENPFPPHEEYLREHVKEFGVADFQAAPWNDKLRLPVPSQFSFTGKVSGKEINRAYRKLLERCNAINDCTTYALAIGSGGGKGVILPFPIEKNLQIGPYSSSLNADEKNFKITNLSVHLLSR